MEGNCHFLEGNIRAKQKVLEAKRLMAEAGLEPERLEMYNMTAANAALFAQVCNEMTERARKLGPNPLRKEKAGVS